MSQHEMATDRLISIIQSIQMAQGSGVLTVRRGEGGTLEEGTIVFLNGQVKETTVGRRTGVEARNWLSTWGSCRYIFASSGGTAPRQIPLLNAGPSTSQGNMPSTPANPHSGILSTPFLRPPSPSLQISVIAYPIQLPAESLRRIEQNGLSRNHRRLFLLIDGQRSMLELARLAGKNQEELQRLLHDLERIGIIQLGGI